MPSPFKSPPPTESDRPNPSNHPISLIFPKLSFHPGPVGNSEAARREIRNSMWGSWLSDSALESHSDEGVKKKKAPNPSKQRHSRDNERDDMHGSVSHRVFSFLFLLSFLFFFLPQSRTFLSCFFSEPIRILKPRGFRRSETNGGNVADEKFKKKEKVLTSSIFKETSVLSTACLLCLRHFYFHVSASGRCLKMSVLIVHIGIFHSKLVTDNVREPFSCREECWQLLRVKRFTSAQTVHSRSDRPTAVLLWKNAATRLELSRCRSDSRDDADAFNETESFYQNSRFHIRLIFFILDSKREVLFIWSM